MVAVTQITQREKLVSHRISVSGLMTNDLYAECPWSNFQEIFKFILWFRRTYIVINVELIFVSSEIYVLWNSNEWNYFWQYSLILSLFTHYLWEKLHKLFSLPLVFKLIYSNIPICIPLNTVAKCDSLKNVKLLKF